MPSPETRKPPDLAVVLAVNGRPMRGGDSWWGADEVRSRLRALGFEVTTQWVGGKLSRLAREKCPMVERGDQYVAYSVYRVTTFGRTYVRNLLPNVDLRDVAEPTPAGVAALDEGGEGDGS